MLKIFTIIGLCLTACQLLAWTSVDLNSARQMHLTCDNLLRPDGFLVSPWQLPLQLGERRRYRDLGDYVGNAFQHYPEVLIEIEGRPHPLHLFFPYFTRHELNRVIRDNQSVNCFNTAIRLSGEQLPRGYLSGLDFLANIRDQERYRLLGPLENPQLGDIVIIWRKPDGGKMPPLEEQIKRAHAAVFIDGDLFLHKGSLFDADPLVFERLGDMVGHFLSGNDRQSEMNAYTLTFHRPQTRRLLDEIKKR